MSARGIRERLDLSWLVALSSSIAILLSSFQVLNSLSLGYYPIVHRLTTYETLVITLFSPETDALLARLAVAISFASLAILLHLYDRGPEVWVPVTGAIAALLTPTSYLTR